jgi:hypothetical protein
MRCRVVKLVLALEQHTQRLLLLVLTRLAGGGAAALEEHEVTNGLAYLAVLCNAAYGGRSAPAGGCFVVCAAICNAGSQMQDTSSR